jgi:thiamine-phosphate pyrophosphorylase
MPRENAIFAPSSYNRRPVPRIVNPPAVLRLLDANANRAREGLRVMEDYARFVLNCGELSGQLKALRHDLADTTRDLLPDAILHRDTGDDVGTHLKTLAELQRQDIGDIVTAAGKRVGEALRAIEESCKVLCPAKSATVESLRYRLYTLEQQLARTLRPGDRFAGVRLYVLITESACRIPWLAAAEAAIRGGADCLQLREKSLDAAELLRRAKSFVQLCRQHCVISIINDRPDIAILSDADGVHVGQEDLPAIEARKLIGTGKIMGVSTHRIEQARAAVSDGADYIGVGPMYRSVTKPRDFVAGLEYARQAAGEIRIPAVAIAGITEDDVDDVTATGVQAIAVTAAVIGCDDIEGAARRMKQKVAKETDVRRSHHPIPAL